MNPADQPSAANDEHTWREHSAFAGRFCGWCGVDEDDYDDPRREGGCEAS